MQTCDESGRQPGLDAPDRRGVPETRASDSGKKNVPAQNVDAEYVDVATVLKVSQAVSGEITLEKLVEVLLRTAIEQAGAERALLILPRGIELWIQAEAKTHGDFVTVRLSESPVSAAELPLSIVRYSARTQETVILHDASAPNPYSADDYIREQLPRSVLCMPLVKQTTLVALLYLENNLGPNVFAPARITVLKVLASAAAISLDNSRLYRELQEREGRIRRLVDANIIGVLISDSQGQIIESNDAFLKMVGYTRDEFVSGRMCWRDMTPSEWKDASEQGVVQVETTGVCKVFEKEYYRKDGRRVPVLVGAARFEKNSTVAFAIDLTERKQAEEALRRSEFYLAEGQRLSHAGSWSFKPDLICDYWSCELYEILGFDPKNGIPTIADYLTRVHPLDRLVVEATIRRMITAGEGCDIKKRVIRLDGIQRVIRCVGMPVRENGVVTRFVGTLMDITEQETLTQELRRREAYLAEAQRLSHTGSFGWNVVTNEETWSEENYRILGYDTSVKPSFQLILDRVHPDDLQLWQEAFGRAAEGKEVDFEHRLVLPDGSVKHLHVVAYGAQKDGKFIELVGTVRDISEQKRVEEAIRRSEAFLAEGQRLSHTGSWGWNASTRKLTWSQEHFRILGLNPQDITPSLEVFWERVHPDDRAALRRTFKSATQEKRNFEQEFRIVTPDWSIRHLHGVGHAVLDKSNELVEFVGSTMDITERKRAEERAQSQSEAIRLALNAFVEKLDVDRFLEDVIAELNKQLHAKSWGLWLFDEAFSELSLHLCSHPGESQARGKIRRPEDLISSWRFKNIARMPQVIELPARGSILAPKYSELLIAQGVRTLLIAPLALREQNLGFFELHFQSPRQFTSDDLELAQALVNYATLALQLNRLTRRAERLAVTEERNRLARDIHDTLAQAFAGIVLHSEALGPSLGVSKRRCTNALSSIQKLARSGLDEARRSVQALRPKALEGGTLSEALNEAAKRFGEGGSISCQFRQYGESPVLSAEAQNELFRITQEALTNVTKHARATLVWIDLASTALTIRDNGVGMAGATSTEPMCGFGLGTMRERAERIGGKLEIESPAGGGTSIRIRVPLGKNGKIVKLHTHS
jgi:PAS domain S-box-containing protein